MKNCELINGSVHINTISFNMAVVADTLYHVKFAVTTVMGMLPKVIC
jgi:hypothetical protein